MRVQEVEVRPAPRAARLAPARSPAVVKRVVGICGALLLLVLLSWLLLLIAVAIRVDSGGPVLFRQRRIGRHARPFEFAKFRTMVPNAESMAGGLCARSQDPHW